MLTCCPCVAKILQGLFAFTRNITKDDMYGIKIKKRHQLNELHNLVWDKQPRKNGEKHLIHHLNAALNAQLSK